MRRSIIALLACLSLGLVAAPGASAASNITVVAGNGTVNNAGAPGFAPTGPNSQIGADLISTQLSAGTPVNLNTSSAASDPGIITFSAPVTSTGAGALNLNAASSVAFNSAVSVATLSVTAADNVTQAAALTVTGNAGFATNTSHDVTLTNPNNDFATVFTSGPVADLSITDKNALNVGDLDVNGVLTLATSGAITQSAGTSFIASNATFSAGVANDITLNNTANALPSLSVTSVDDVSYTDQDSISLREGSDISGDLTINASGAVTESGTAGITVGGTASINAPGAGGVLLPSTTNQLNAIGVGTSGTVNIGDANDLTLLNSGAGTMSVRAGDDLSLPTSTTITAGGGLSLIADNANPSPAIGTGGISILAGSQLTGSGAVRLYGSTRAENSIAANATFNGSTYTPGPIFVNSPREQWGVYALGGTATAPFTVFFKDADTVDPAATITAPQNGGTYQAGQVVNADYACSDPGGAGIASCTGTVANGAAIDTSTAGQKSFSVDAEDAAGNTSTTTVNYTVTVKPAPDPKCGKLRKKLKRQKVRVRQLRGTAKQAFIESNIKDTRARMKKLGC